MNLPIFDMSKIKKQMKRIKKKPHEQLDNLETMLFLSGNKHGLERLQQYRDFLDEGKPPKPWKPAFPLNKSHIWEMYSWNYISPPMKKAFVENSFVDWFKINYEMAAYAKNYHCLLRSALFWKTLYVQELLDRSQKKTKWAKKAADDGWDAPSRDIIDDSSCASTPLYNFEALFTIKKHGYLAILPQPLWVLYRMLYGDGKFLKKIVDEKKWMEQLDSKMLLNIEPLLREVWKKEFRQNLQNLQSEFFHYKTGAPEIFGNRFGSVNTATGYELKYNFKIPMNIQREIAGSIDTNSIHQFAGIKNISTIEGEFILGPESEIKLNITAPSNQQVNPQLLKNDIRSLIIAQRSNYPYPELMDILLSSEWVF